MNKNEAIMNYEKSRDIYDELLAKVNELEKTRLSIWNLSGAFGAVRLHGFCNLRPERNANYINCENVTNAQEALEQEMYVAKHKMNRAYREAILYSK